MKIMILQNCIKILSYLNWLCECKKVTDGTAKTKKVDPDLLSNPDTTQNRVTLSSLLGQVSLETKQHLVVWSF